MDTPATCDALAPVPDTVQVAWVSKLGKRAGSRTVLQVVRVADLRKRVEVEQRDPQGVLQALGLVGRKATGDVSGVRACEEKWQRPASGVRDESYSGCGYAKDTQTGERTLDVFHVDWEHAASWGFCVMPFERFVNGA
jgi:hypothetical protein